MQQMGRDETLITKATVDHLVSIIEPGDILLSHERQRLTSLFIKGFWDHAAIVTNYKTVIEAVGTGVQEVPLEEWLYKKDYVKVKRTYFSKTTRISAAHNARDFIGFRYNFLFTFGNPFHWSAQRRGVYCSELVLKSYAGLEFMKNLFPNPEILPSDFDRVFETVWDTKADSLPESTERHQLPPSTLS